MLDNLTHFKDPLMSEAVLTALVGKGMPRQEAHRLLQQLLSQSKAKNERFSDALAKNSTVATYLSRKEIEAALDPQSYLGASAQLVDLAVERATAERRARGLVA
jgi:adenylosuccinate lyase